MSLSTNSTFNPILSEALNKIGENRFVGTQVLPVREVGLKNGVFPVFGDAQFDNNASKTRAPGTLFGRRDFAYEQDSYSCLQYALEGVLPDEDETEANENGISDVTGALAQKLQRALRIQIIQEKEVENSEKNKSTKNNGAVTIGDVINIKKRH